MFAGVDHASSVDFSKVEAPSWRFQAARLRRASRLEAASTLEVKQEARSTFKATDIDHHITRKSHEVLLPSFNSTA